MKNNILFGLLIALVTILMIIFRDFLLEVDTIFYSAINNFEHHNLLVPIMKFISFLGSVYFYVPLTLLIVLFYKNKDKWLVPIMLILSFLFNSILKNMFQRIRPEDALVFEESFSFPSGHAMVAGTFVSLLIYLIMKNNLSKKYKIVFTISLILFLILISFSRMYLNVHYFTDVIFGSLIGILFTYIVVEIKEHFFDR